MAREIGLTGCATNSTALTGPSAFSGDPTHREARSFVDVAYRSHQAHRLLSGAAPRARTAPHLGDLLDASHLGARLESALADAWVTALSITCPTRTTSASSSARSAATTHA